MKETKAKLVIRQCRTFSTAFKQAKVEELIKKQISIKELCELYAVSRTAVYKWLYKYSPHHHQNSILVVQMESEENKTRRLQRQLAELERVVGQKQLEIDFLNKLLELGSQEMGFDLKKNFSTKLSSGTGSGEPNTSIK